MKWALYYISWILPVYFFTVLFDLGVTAFFTWYYYEMNLPTLTPRLYLLIWIGCMVLIGVFVYMFINGVAKKHYAGRPDYPITTFIITQSLATVTYILAAVFSKFNGMLCFPSVYLSFVINEFMPDIITDENQATWTVLLMLLHAVTFTAIAVLAYLKERKRIVDMHNQATTLM